MQIWFWVHYHFKQIESLFQSIVRNYSHTLIRTHEQLLQLDNRWPWCLPLCSGKSPFLYMPTIYDDFPGSSGGKECACNAGDLGLIPGSARCPGEGNGNPFQYSCLENSVNIGAWRVNSLWGCKESDMTEQTFTHTHLLQFESLPPGFHLLLASLKCPEISQRGDNLVS